LQPLLDEAKVGLSLVFQGSAVLEPQRRAQAGQEDGGTAQHSNPSMWSLVGGGFALAAMI
jgi:hypothetical protein